MPENMMTQAELDAIVAKLAPSMDEAPLLLVSQSEADTQEAASVAPSAVESTPSDDDLPTTRR
jgi:hypothetical protein